MPKTKNEDIQMDEELCEGCGEGYGHKKTVKEAKKMKSLKPAAREQMQDSFDPSDDEIDQLEEEIEEELDEEVEEELDEGSLPPALAKHMKKKGSSKDEEDDSEDDSEEDDSEDEEDEEDMKESFSVTKESISEIFAGETLTEEAQMKVATLFEAAVNERVKLVENELANKFTELLESEVEEIANTLVEKVDSYLEYVVGEWMEENKLAVDSGVRTEVLESFVSGLHNLFLEHNINVPEGQVDLLDETAGNLQRVTEQLNIALKKNIELSEELKSFERAEMFAEMTEGLSDVQVEKLRSLAESMEYSDNEEFAKKLSILKENYSKSSAQKPTVASIQVEDTSEPETLTESTSGVEAYAHALKRKIV